jgi:SAM-dependent methyltransferase
LPDLHYVHPALAALYDLDNGWSEDRDFYLGLASGGPKRVLDLGCGTGLLADVYASRGHRVTGVDPARAMLDVARTKPHGSAIEWVESPAEAFRTEDRFDLIVMTGNAFQVFLADADIVALFATMRGHLAPGGVIAFETRNPAVDWASRWNTDADLELGDVIVHQSRRVLARQGDRIAFDTVYRFPDMELTSHSELRFSTKAEIEARLMACGLSARAVYGGWQRQPFDAATSEEMVFVAEAV